LSIASAGTDFLAPPSGTSLLRANSGGALANAASGTDYGPPTSGLSTGIVKSTTGTGAHTIAVAGTDYQAPITLTTTGTAGAATFTSNTLNIPNYATSGSALQTTGGTMTGNIALAAGTTSLAPLTFVTGANLTSAVGGSIEYDGTCFFASIGSATRTGVRSDQLAFLNTAYPLVSQIAAQKAFNSTANGQVSLVAGTHEFECLLNLSGMSATSGSFGFALTGGATFTQQWHAMAIKAAALATAATWQQSFNTAANTTLATASTATVGFAFIRGRLNVTVSGTVIPQVSLTVAAAANVGAGSYFKVGALGSGSGTTNIVVGTWS
jgi:hypothetical protein